MKIKYTPKPIPPCKHCGSREYYREFVGNHTGIYCKKCRKWICWR